MSDLLVLGGGAGKGAYEAGAIQWLIGEQKICYDGYVGSSAGGLNALMLSMFKKGEEPKAAEFVRETWLDIKGPGDIYKSWFPFGKLHFALPAWTKMNKASFYNNEPLRRRVEDQFVLEKFRGSGKMCRLVAVSLDSGDVTYFDENCSDPVAAVMASASFPVAFPPERIAGEWFTDGGVKETIPVSGAIKLGATKMDVICTSPDPYPYEPLSANLEGIDLGLRVIDLMSDEIAHTDIPNVQRINKRVLDGEEEDPKKRYVEMRVLKPDHVLTDDSLSFDPKSIKEMLDQGYEDAKKTFNDTR